MHIFSHIFPLTFSVSLFIITVIITILEGYIMIKYSRQREHILQYLRSTTKHPTAETIYQHMKTEHPNISLGTVYRNLALLVQLGEIQKISSPDGADRFDANTSPHYHFICTECGAVLDLELSPLDHINLLAEHKFQGTIEGHVTLFYGKCPDCSHDAHVR